MSELSKRRNSPWRTLCAIGSIGLFTLCILLFFSLSPRETLLQSPQISFQKGLGLKEKNSFRRAEISRLPNARVFGLDDGSRLWLVTASFILTSEDEGDTWKAENLPIRSNTFYNYDDTHQSDSDETSSKVQQKNWHSISNFNQLMISRDEGESWSPDSGTAIQLQSTIDNLPDVSPVTFNIATMAFSANNQGIAVGGDGFFVQGTTNEGKRWLLQSGSPNPLKQQQGGSAQTLYGAALNDDGSVGYAVGSLGAVKLWRSNQKSGANAWKFKLSGLTLPKLLAVDTNSEGNVAFAVGEKMSIFKSGDSGESWQQHYFPWQTSDSSIKSITGITRDYHTFSLRKISLSANGQFGLVVGGNKAGKGVLARTENGGNTWLVQALESGVEYHDVKLSGDASVAYAVGGKRNTQNDLFEGSIYRSTDYGKNWTPVELKGGGAGGNSLPRLNSLFISSNAQLVIATTQDGRLLVSKDFGESWELGPEHSFVPPMWLFVGLLTAIGLGVAVFFFGKPEAKKNEEGFFTNDFPVADQKSDKLNFTPVADSLSRYLRNPATQPPLNVAITAPWGAGKSSLMNLLVNDLKRHNYRTVWFNAWHHQSEEHLFASLLEAICKQGIPKWWLPEGVLFYFRLLMIRLWRDFTSTRVLFFLLPLVLLGSAVYGGDQFNPELSEDFRQLGFSGGILLFGAWMWWRVKAIAVQPAKLLSKLAGRYGIRHFKDQLSFRHNFIEEFKDVNQALSPTSLVIIIDDLDRCQPAHILEILESINFLTNAGRCFVVFGMDAGPVLASLELEFEEIANKLSKYQNSRIQNAYDYARNYLEKMVNIEIPVPQLNKKTENGLETTADESFFELVQEQPKALSETKWGKWLRETFISVSMVIGLVSFVSFSGLLIGKELSNVAQVSKGLAPKLFPGFFAASVTQPKNQEQAKKRVNRAVQVNLEVPAPPERTDEQILNLSLLDRDTLPEFNTAPVKLKPLGLIDYLIKTERWVWLLLAGSFILVVFSFIEWLRLKQSMSTDSSEFLEALGKWLVTLTQYRSTPRALKRFINRVRFISMMQKRLSLEKRMPEKFLVGLGVLNAQLEEATRQKIDIADLFDSKGNFDDAAFNKLKQVMDAKSFEKTLKSLQEEPDWPPPQEQFDTFRALSRGVLIR